MNNTLKLILKIIVSGFAFWWVVRQIDMVSVWERISSAQWWWILTALLTYVISQILSALRVNSLYKTVPLHLPTSENSKLYWLGMFYNFFLPGGVGGDGYKVYYLHKYYDSKVKNIISLLLCDRISGLAAICIYLLLFTSFFIEDLPLPYREYLFLFVPAIFLGFYIAVRFLNKKALPAQLRVMAYSLLIQGLQMATAMLIFIAIGGDIRTTDNYMFLFFLSSIASAIPISFGGIGLREMTFIIGSEYLLVDNDISVALSVLFYTTSLVSSIPGVVYAIRPSLINKGRHVPDNTNPI